MARSFTLLRKLGHGAFGAVHLAEVRSDEGLVQRLAVKWLHEQWSHDTEKAGRLRDEARLLGLLNHEHIVRVHALTRIDDRFAILMEPVDGVDLSEISPPLPSRCAIEIVEAVATALADAWGFCPPGTEAPLHVVHRDIKPSNVMVTGRGLVKVMDFGVARASFEEREAQTRSQQYGTARYMAPERWLHGDCDAPSDIFSLGITLIELLTGPVPRLRLSEQGFSEDLTDAVTAVSHPDLQKLCTDMCAFDPHARPTAAEVQQRCQELTHSLDGPDLRSWSREVVQDTMEQRPTSEDQPRVLLEDSASFTIGLTQTSASSLTAMRPPSPAPDLAPLWFWLVYGAAFLVIVAGSALGLGSLFAQANVAATAADARTQTLVQPMPPVTQDTIVTLKSESAKVQKALPLTRDDPVPQEVSADILSLETHEDPSTPSPPPEGVPETPTENETSPEPVATTPIIFILAPTSLQVNTPSGPIQHRRALMVPRNTTLSVTIGEGASQWSCTVPVSESPSTWRIDGTSPGSGTCIRAN